MKLGEFRRLTQGIDDEADLTIQISTEYDDGDGFVSEIEDTELATAKLCMGLDAVVYINITRELK